MNLERRLDVLEDRLQIPSPEALAATERLREACAQVVEAARSGRACGSCAKAAETEDAAFWREPVTADMPVAARRFVDAMRRAMPHDCCYGSLLDWVRAYDGDAPPPIGDPHVCEAPDPPTAPTVLGSAPARDPEPIEAAVPTEVPGEVPNASERPARPATYPGWEPLGGSYVEVKRDGRRVKVDPATGWPLPGADDTTGVWTIARYGPYTGSGEPSRRSPRTA